MDQVRLPMATALSDGSGPPIMSVLFRNDLRNRLMTQGVDLACKFPQIPIRSSTCGICWNKLDPWRLPHRIQDPQDPQQTSSCQTLQDTPWGLMTMFWKVRAVFAAQRGNRTILSRCVLCCGWSVCFQVYFYCRFLLFYCKCLYILHAFFCKLCSSSAYMVISLHSLAFNPLICAPLIMTFHTHQVEPSDSWLN